MSLDRAFRVRFGDLASGWIDMQILADGREFNLTSSYSPYDSVRDLAEAVLAIASHHDHPTRKVSFSTGPQVYDLVLTTLEDGKVALSVTMFHDWRRSSGSGSPVFSYVGESRDTCLAFWRALRDLGGRFGGAEYVGRWHSTYPEREVAALGSALKGPVGPRSRGAA